MHPPEEISNFEFRIFHLQTCRGAGRARSLEVPGIPIRRESACQASSREARRETGHLEVRSALPERGSENFELRVTITTCHAL